MKILLGILMFFILCPLFIISNNNLALSKSENVEIFRDLFLRWVDQIYQNFQVLTGEAVKQEWFLK